MAKKEKEAMAEDVAVEESLAVPPTVAEETYEQARDRLAREDYQRRNEQALAERKAILESNGLKFEDHTSTDGVEVVRRCCGK